MSNTLIFNFIGIFIGLISIFISISIFKSKTNEKLDSILKQNAILTKSQSKKLVEMYLFMVQKNLEDTLKVKAIKYFPEYKYSKNISGAKYLIEKEANSVIKQTRDAVGDFYILGGVSLKDFLEKVNLIEHEIINSTKIRVLSEVEKYFQNKESIEKLDSNLSLEIQKAINESQVLIYQKLDEKYCKE
jgi:hypothetical protein